MLHSLMDAVRDKTEVKMGSVCVSRRQMSIKKEGRKKMTGNTGVKPSSVDDADGR